MSYCISRHVLQSSVNEVSGGSFVCKAQSGPGGGLAAACLLSDHRETAAASHVPPLVRKSHIKMQNQQQNILTLLQPALTELVLNASQSFNYWRWQEIMLKAAPYKTTTFAFKPKYEYVLLEDRPSMAAN